ncbi:hypothetical protein E2C01_093359 [Portunus trituberculatus]|uniref:Uncharacterized protein n=1 Tax=Portunus trituberculatus TaxID=210409 RepID=A0A5B7JMI7_PORTR|nr:hypothetical protein [Portunus trituberculatus]
MTKNEAAVLERCLEWRGKNLVVGRRKERGMKRKKNGMKRKKLKVEKKRRRSFEWRREKEMKERYA